MSRFPKRQKDKLRPRLQGCSSTDSPIENGLALMNWSLRVTPPTSPAITQLPKIDVHIPEVAQVESWVRRYFKATRSGNARVWFSAFAENAVVEDPVGNSPLTTGRAILAHVDDFIGAFETIGLYENFIHVNSNEAVAKWTGHGTTTHGQEVTFEGVDLFEFDSLGKIVRLCGLALF